MSGLLLGLRREIARNRRKQAYMTGYVPKAAPAAAVSGGRIRIEPESLDDLETDTEIVRIRKNGRE